jgi:hypothetical protein
MFTPVTPVFSNNNTDGHDTTVKSDINHKDATFIWMCKEEQILVNYYIECIFCLLQFCHRSESNDQ